MIPKRYRPAVVAGLTAAVASGSLLAPPAHADAPKSEPRKADRKAMATFARIADDVLSRRTQALVEEHAGRGGSGDGAATTRMSGRLKKDEDAALRSLRARKARLAKLGEAYTKADTRVVVDRATVTGGTATVQVTSSSTLTYKKVRGDEPATTAFSTRQELKLAGTKDGGWKLTAITSRDDGPGAVNEPSVARVNTVPDDGNQYPDGTPASTKRPSTPTPSGKTATTYDYAAMARYAEKYWYSYNRAYRKFNGAGGDCTNFVSQALQAGGWKPVPGSAQDYRNWWYGSTSQSTSWVGVNEWAWFTLSNRRAPNLANVYQLDVGDVLQVDFDKNGSKDHTMMVTYRNGRGMPYLTYHSTDTYRRSLASVIASYPDARYFAYRT
ncbi:MULTISPECIES: amidase domain-containing protein [Streptomyces]|uniref:amidase domain-containing protein n=1 Tax=Streptomyces TaxID=1883 RepID=UPI001E3836BC|nr:MULTISPECIES: amidase domain-containing protein [Streptomyces]UFQ14210.1 amidase domain-containing protein [Streptomyces huasconensis]WCL83809.1 amidase domain-containing protein [Streptomyces sp. JCM 35825]